MFNRVLVPTDFTAKSDHALKTAIQIAKKTNSIVDLMHIVESPLVIKNKADINDGMTGLAKNMIELSTGRLNYLKSQYDQEGVTINVRTKIDELPEKVAELITQEDYDLMVIGGSTVYPFYEFIRKTHPERIVELAKCPVLVLNKPIESFNLEKVVIPSSLDHGIEKVMGQIKEIIAFFNAEMEVLYVNTPSTFKTDEEIDRDWLKFSQQHDIAGVKLKVYNDLSVKKGIVRYAKKQGVDLILLTSRHTKKPLSIFKGDITEYIVNHEDFPVLTFNVRTIN